jgi:hypothetical protein
MEIKGTAVIAIRDYVKTNYGDRYKEWLQSLPDNVQSIYSGMIDSSGWYPLGEGGLIPTKKTAEMFFNGDYEKGAWDAGKFSAQKALTGIYKIFVKASSPGYIIQRASRVFSTYYRPCGMSVIDRKEKSVLLEISNMTESDIVIEYRIAGWIQKALEISGSKNVTIEFPQSISRGDEVTRIDIRWE